MPKYKTHNKGFTLVEVVIALAVLLTTEAVFYSSYEVLQKRARTIKLNNACNLLVLELSAMQTRAFYVNDGLTQSIKVHTDGSGYDLNKGTEQTKTVKLSQLGWGCLKLFCVNDVQFLPGGVPKVYAKIIVQVRDDEKLKKIVEVQPVTGRIVVKDD
jgi:prepilin-type N-terminal cleavage/methylation domain-containing protein